jgi:ABC-type multidrug transport system fused ATPase/permease subunit
MQAKLMMIVSQNSIEKLRNDLFDKMQGLPVRFFDQRSTGEVMSRYTNDVDNIQMMLNSTMTSLFSGVCTIIGTLFFMFFTDAYDEEELENGDKRVVMHFSPVLAPVKAAILPLKKKAHGETAEKIRKELSYDFVCTYDESGSIGKRYRRQDEIGTPYCITVDDQTLEDGTVTIRYRDSMEQDRLTVEEVRQLILKEIRF